MHFAIQKIANLIKGAKIDKAFSDGQGSPVLLADNDRTNSLNAQTPLKHTLVPLTESITQFQCNDSKTIFNNINELLKLFISFVSMLQRPSVVCSQYKCNAFISKFFFCITICWLKKASFIKNYLSRSSFPRYILIFNKHKLKPMLSSGTLSVLKILPKASYYHTWMPANMQRWRAR